MIINREEFARHFNTLKDGLGGPDSALWIPEEDSHPADLSNWFVCVEPIGVSRFKWAYWEWCNETLQGKVRCYSSNTDDQQEWWGFTDKDDIVVWMLKWM